MIVLQELLEILMMIFGDIIFVDGKDFNIVNMIRNIKVNMIGIWIFQLDK